MPGSYPIGIWVDVPSEGLTPFLVQGVGRIVSEPKQGYSFSDMSRCAWKVSNGFSHERLSYRDNEGGTIGNG